MEEEEDDQAGELPEELEDALWKYIEGHPYKLILKQEHIRNFLAAKDRLDQIFNAYLTFCPKENKKLVFFIRTARRRVHYGSPIHLLPLLCCDLDPIDDAKAASTLYTQGIRDVKQLSLCNPSSMISWLSIPADEAQRTVQTAAGIVGLIESASGDKTILGTLSTKTGIKVNDLVDYFLPPDLVEGA